MIANQPSTSTLVAIRAAHHAESTPQYDRVVFEFSGPVPLIEVKYVKQLLGDASGLPVPITGGAIVEVQFRPAQAHDTNGHVTAPSQAKPNLPIVKEIVGAGDFEAVLTYGIGVDRKTEMRVITLGDASRVVIDFIQ